MGKQQNRLHAVLLGLDFSEADKPPIPTLSTLPPAAREKIVELYRDLGGVHPAPRLRTGPWDSVYSGNLAVVLDESPHLNRYRSITLEPEWAQPLPWQGPYRKYAGEFEGACPDWGGYWTNESAEKQFGPPGPRGQLDGAGSPCGKQRALSDAMRDLAALHGQVRIARLSVYDSVGSVTLEKALGGNALMDTDALRALIDQRTLG